ncbi:DUF4097 family beta strand repeat-containing protein [Fulvivirga ligni]|uniref:DUF4097 family beta strand repeat-containing protein n=1 Tax=Fulvivirga ligni TaxID=2904246 RepID=UPI001F3F7AB9|nr:DUF4097 family beta strand repeat-containing protein [Fulvivirga ligni]UII21110.1 DUF4097 domain-containing protein [Fulvivirga ligni]
MKSKMKYVMLVMICFALSPVMAQYKIPMSSGLLELSELYDVQVEGYSGNEVIISTKGKYDIPERAKGLKPINGLGLTDNTGVGLSVKDDGKEHKVVSQVARNSDVGYIVKVPNGVRIKYVNSSIHGDDFTGMNIQGELEVSTHGGSIKLKNISGPVTLSSVHGDIEVVMADKMNQSMPSAITSVHGDVDLAVPAGSNAAFEIATTWGEVYSDLDLKVDQPDGMKVYGAKKISGKLGNGGSKIALSSTHGNVYLRSK